ncbi:class I SAM-dependent methyltransferase [Leptothoe spongobia]|uniref:Methyltransferase domain-containing protein n=1 Tax=Leptothoe spongobia TAU-MAC 1115 TaxID=1967444 RepID=A0A947GKR0_9CYAN|nr:class I SAM-dependent methyltransferase [Leptothoe spongobia]MBT9314441.1 methyltransferase domain-containing protein [Leptothoe spongobia TAU-MAC 1115]
MNTLELSIPQNIPLENSITPSECTCPNCGHQGLSIFYDVRQVPVHSCLMLPTQEDALNFPQGDVILGVCAECGFITNVAFDPQWSAYAPNYEDQQSFSPTFNQFALDLANRLIDKYDLRNQDIIEIGCSKGDFLLLLCELGGNRGVGIDPSVLPGRVQNEAASRVTFIQDYYSEKHAQYVGEFICCRHTLEHIQPTAEFLKTVRTSIGDRQDTVIFFEVPDTIRVLQDLAFEDIYYEHCSYFTPGSLARLFRSCGFEVIDLYRAYGDQYLLIEAKPTATRAEQVHPLEETPAQLVQTVQAFITRIQQKLAHWKQTLEQFQASGKRVVVWGSGSKCVSFLTTLDTVDLIQYVVDINPHRQGKFIPGVGKEIMAPEFLTDYQPDHVIVMNPIYLSEIQHSLDSLGVITQVMSV